MNILDIAQMLASFGFADYNTANRVMVVMMKEQQVLYYFPLYIDIVAGFEYSYLVYRFVTNFVDLDHNCIRFFALLRVPNHIVLAEYVLVSDRIPHCFEEEDIDNFGLIFA
jgi:hypothetical protein